MSTRKTSVAQSDAPASAPDVVQQLLAERRELKVANERLRLELDETKSARTKPDRRLSLLEDENRRLRKELAATRAEHEVVLEGLTRAVEGLERATG
jgi:cell shape-determining protein MreC